MTMNGNRGGVGRRVPLTMAAKATGFAFGITILIGRGHCFRAVSAAAGGPRRGCRLAAPMISWEGC
jgi:hypothetical protein